MRRACRLCILSVLLCALSSPAIAQDDESAWSFSLDSVTVRGYRYRLPVKAGANGVMSWDMSSISILPQILGNADPMHYAQILPGIQTNSEYRSGINIEGCDNQHNTISIEGVPIYNVNHLLGFFSTFNSFHFQSMSISKGIISSESSNRLGGQLDISHFTEVSDTLSGQFSLGLVSSQGTICLPVNAKTSLTASLRGAYVNLLYSQWLKADGQQVNYSFYDANVSLVHHPNRRNTFIADYYGGYDDVGVSEANYLADMGAKWGNTMVAAHWLYDNDDLYAKTTAYVTSYRNRFSLEMQDMMFKLPSSIMDIGLKTAVEWKGWSAGLEAVHHHIHPQSVELHGSFNISDGHAPSMTPIEISVFGNYGRNVARYMSIFGGIRGSLFKSKSSFCMVVDPSLRMIYDNSIVQFSVSYALRHQYLFQTGFSESGLPTEFWISATKDHTPQYAHESSISGGTFLWNRRYKVSADVFYRRLYHQLAYKGSVLDYVNSAYDINTSLMHGEGENYGFSLMLNKCSGPLTGWISYTYTNASRSFDGLREGKTYSASHERPHEITALATYSLGRHWDFGGTFVYASGTPFTAIKSIYVLNNNLMVKYGDYNAARLRPYVRLDLSANYKWGRKHEKGLNLSLYNVTCRDNELFYYLRTREDGSFVYRPVTFVLRVLPSFSYYFKF